MRPRARERADACQFGSIVLAGTAQTHLATALDALGEVYDLEAVEWPISQSAGVLIIGLDGASVPMEDGYLNYIRSSAP